MSAKVNNEEILYTEYKQLVKSSKVFAKEKLVNFNWLENLRLKARQYIDNNGPNTTSDEVTDFLLSEAFGTFPTNIKDEMVAKMDIELSEIMSSMKLT